jgi:hypothetical protein
VTYGRAFLKALFWSCIAVSIAGMAGAFIYGLSFLHAKHSGSPYPIQAAGQIYGMDISGRGGPPHIVFVTATLHAVVVAAQWAMAIWLALGTCFFAWAIARRLSRNPAPD